MSGTRYREGRKQAGLTLGHGSKYTGIETTRLSAIELDRIAPTEDEQRSMADRYGCSIEWLRGDPVEVPEDFKRMVRDADISFRDRDELLRFAASLPRNDKTAGERLAKIAAQHAEPDPAAEVPRAVKVRYVRSQGQTRGHHCHWPDCNLQVPPAMWGCNVHWFRLPKTLRDRVWRSYVPGQEVDMSPSDEYLKVADDVQAWIREHGGTP